MENGESREAIPLPGILLEQEGESLRKRGLTELELCEHATSPGANTSQECQLSPEQIEKLDLAAMKAKVRQALRKPEPYNVTNFYWKTGLWQRVARSAIFENITLGVISLNALWIAVDTDLNTSSSLLGSKPFFQAVEQAFCFYFTFEWFVRYMSFRRKKDGLHDFWFVFDSALVLMMVVETWVMTSLILLTGSGGGGGLGGASILRLFRLLRLSRMARMLRSMPELMILIKGMVAAMRSVFFVLCLLLIIMYMFAIALTQLSGEDTVIGGEYFPDVLNSIYTLWIYGTLLDDLAGICSEIKEESPLCLFVFIVFMLLSALTVMNMLIGVLCEGVFAVAATEKEEMKVTFVSSRLMQIMQDIDKDCDFKISKVEFMSILEHKEACLALVEVDVNPEGIMDFANFIFDGEAEDGEECKKSFDDFMGKILELSDSKPSAFKDIVELRSFISEKFTDLESDLFGPDFKRKKKIRSEALRRENAKDFSEWDKEGSTSTAGENGKVVVPPMASVGREQLQKDVDLLKERTAGIEAMLGMVLNEVRSLKSPLQQQHQQQQASGQPCRATLPMPPSGLGEASPPPPVTTPMQCGRQGETDIALSNLSPEAKNGPVRLPGMLREISPGNVVGFTAEVRQSVVATAATTNENGCRAVPELR